MKNYIDMKTFIKRIRLIANLRQFIPFLIDFFKSKQVTMGKKLLFLFILFGYTLFPFDIIPDFLLVFGVIDDVAVIAYVFQFMIKTAPEELRAKHDLNV